MNGIRSRVLKTEEIEWQNASWLQNENLKELSSDSVEKLKTSLKNNSFVMPFHVWQDGEKTWILDGHHRQKALQLLKDEGNEIPNLLPATFIDCEDIKEASKLVLIYTSQYAKITQQGLHDFFEKFDLDLAELKFEIDIPDFSLPRFEQKFDVFGVGEDNGEDENGELAEDIEILVKRGDIFQLGNHFLICGDSTDRETFEKLLGDKKAQIIFTDPPYNLPYSDFGGKGNVQHSDFAMASGEMSDSQFADFLAKYMKNCVEFSVDGSIHYHFMDFRHVWHVCQAAALQETYKTVEPKQICVWNKSVGANGSFYRAKHEFCLIFKNGKAKHKSKLELVDRIRYNVWDYHSANDFGNPERERNSNKYGIGELANHPTPKPTPLVADAIIDSTDEGDIVIDCFLGSGTTLIAAEKTDRVCYGIEYEPKYVQSIINRYAKYCNKNNKDINFVHLNGSINLNDIINDTRITTESGASN
jgi:DNA modification methylase